MSCKNQSVSRRCCSCYAVVIAGAVNTLWSAAYQANYQLTHKKKTHRQSLVCWRNTMPSAHRFDWSRQNSQDHMIRMNTDRKLPKEPDCHSFITPLVFATKWLLILSFRAFSNVQLRPAGACSFSRHIREPQKPKRPSKMERSAAL